MVKCSTCGNDSTNHAAFYWKIPDCHNQDCRGGYVKCTRCIYGPGGYMLKCCGFCGDNMKPAGQRKCTTCNEKHSHSHHNWCAALVCRAWWPLGCWKWWHGPEGLKVERCS
ncbi:uncharacterized protein P884DRAFT_316324 [Thermothelomyces heterothallicus CBS 202.75]|uniref:uncharacterized protein n=1 Tax=Thermothelomyces heterothallicus CBS 202.75 TaxID=1149848 RepID=UPI0037441D0B